MVSLKKPRQQGFTIVELLIVGVVISILAILVFITYNGIQQKNRDTERKLDINELQRQLEGYQAQTGVYPTLANINDKTWRASNMKGLDLAKLADPNKPKNQTLVGSPASNVYSYQTQPANCDNGGNGDCTQYTLTATLESGGIYSRQALNQ